jgi:predicted membrane chloride channel (bestrophin family)
MKNLLLGLALLVATVSSVAYLAPLASVLVTYTLIAAAVALQESKIWKN